VLSDDVADCIPAELLLFRRLAVLQLVGLTSFSESEGVVVFLPLGFDVAE
jgi:hypothetical protein